MGEKDTKAEKRHCLTCGRGFYPSTSNQRYCCEVCRTNSKAPRDVEYSGEMRTCLCCGKRFPAIVGGGWHCSSKCVERTLALHMRIAKRKAR